ncbi:MAG: hypothetical protein IPK72_11450 [Candidatus Eisenbacteria bacterium]|nr:hypothetical protein [Candidatus Eisenbacteria bacterium]
MTAGSVTGAGAISASGGKTLRNGGGGGGGRVALYADACLFSGTLKACGGKVRSMAAPAASTPRSPDNRSVT